MNILEALRQTTTSIKTWAESKFLNKDAINHINYPVKSVNGKTGEVKLTAIDVGADVVANDITSSHNMANDAHSNMGWLSSSDAEVSEPTPLDADTLNGYDASYFNTQIAVERARINNFTALSEGSTTGDAELQDIRVGTDGTIYETAGEAVRGQVKSVEEMCDEMHDYMTKKITASGKVLQAKYVSPISHEVKVKLSSDTITDFSSTTVTLYGKNLFDKSTVTIGVGLATGTGSTYTAADYLTSDYIPITPNTRLVINWIQGKWACCYDADKNYLGQATRSKETDESAVQKVLTTIDDTRFIRFTAVKSEIDDLQLEVSRFPTEYEPYVTPQTVSADSDGNVYGLKSVSPSMTLMTNTDVIIEAEYYMDLTSISNAKTEKTPESHEVISVNHRGFNSIAPENTLPAYILSKAKGFDYAEADIRWTSDGVPVLLHDKTLNRTARNADGTALSNTVNISDISYETALTYDFGIWKDPKYAGTKIPTFTEFMSLCRDISLHPYIEIEGDISTSQAKTLVDIVRDFGMINNVTWVSFNASSLYNICRMHPEARVGYIIDINATWVHDDDHMLTLKSLKTLNNSVFGNVSYQSISALVSDFKAEKIPMETWCIDAEDVILALDPYVTGIASNTLVASKVMEESKTPLYLAPDTITCPSFVKSIAHRGYSWEAPENTLPAYVLAHKKGFKYAECDVRVTKDGVPVLLHDETIDRTSNGSGRVDEMTYDELLQYDFGSWKSPKYAGTKIPTFEEFIRCCKALGLHPYIEVENHSSVTDECVANCVYIVKKYGMLDNVTWVSFGARKLHVIRDTVPNARLGWIGYTANVWAYEELKREGNDVFLNLDIGSITEADIQKAIDNDIPLEVWNINDPAKMLSLPPYIRGVASDYIIGSEVMREAEVIGISKRYFKVSSKLSRVDINNRSTVAAEGSSYSATLTAGDALSVVVTMDGVDITSSVYTDRVINIPSVTGNVIIVATGSEITEGWALVREFEELHQGALSTDYQSGSGLFLYDHAGRVSYPYPDIVAIGGETYKLEYDAPSNVTTGMHFFNQNQMNVFNNKGGGSWSNILDSGTLRSGEEYTPTVEHNSSPIVGVRFTFLKTDGSNITTDEITGVRLYKKLRDQYTISTELDGVTISNDSTTVAGNSSYSATLTANTDIVATVVMGGVDVTAFVYTDGIINIPAVTGDVIITAYSHDNWSLIKTITPDQLHIGGLNPNDSLGNGLYMTENASRLCYPYWDIETPGDETYKVEFDSVTDMKVGLQFFNQWQLSSFNKGSTSNWNNLHDAGLKSNGEEYTPPATTNNGGNVVGLRVYFGRTDNAQVDGTEITEVRVYKKIAE